MTHAASARLPLFFAVLAGVSCWLLPSTAHAVQGISFALALFTLPVQLLLVLVLYLLPRLSPALPVSRGAAIVCLVLGGVVAFFQARFLKDDFRGFNLNLFENALYLAVVGVDGFLLYQAIHLLLA